MRNRGRPVAMKTLLRKASAALASGDEWELSSSSITRAGVSVAAEQRRKSTCLELIRLKWERLASGIV
jgi:hypothetical protein